MKNYLLLFLLFTAALRGNEPLSFLQTKKTAIVDSEGTTFQMRGINLGAWLVEEMWMLPFVLEPPKGSSFSPIKDHVSLWKTFEARFGKEKMEEIRTAFRKTWIQDQDFATIKAAGFNTVRLPFLHDLQNESTGLFYWIDHAISLAKEHGLYLVLDMHGVPGRQSLSMHTGEEDKGEFFSEHSHLSKTCEIWQKIASRYKDCSQIAGYDLVNEPMSASNHTQLAKIYNSIYKAIRSEDKKHILFIQDGYKGITHMPNPKDFKWSNVALSTHHYCFNELSSEDFLQHFNDHIHKAADKQKKIEVPFYLGEFNVAPRGSLDTLKQVIETLHSKNISYSFWSYKIGRRGHKNSLWGLLHAPGKQKNIDPYKDSFKEIMKKIALLKSSNYEKNKDLINLFKK
jgi:endoglucanase